MPRLSRSPWVGVPTGTDPVELASLLRAAHDVALRKGVVPPVLRPVVAKSWQRAAEQGVDPDGRAPARFDAPATARALRDHPASRLLPMVARMLCEATEDAVYFVVLADPEGVLLWIDGHTRALDAAAAPRFLPGHVCSEAAVGTNAVGTAIALDHPVQIFSAEHFNRRLHSLTCSAAPIHDPASGDLVGVLNISGDFRTGHPHSLSLVAAVARVVEEALARELAASEEELRASYIDRLARGGGGRSAIVSRDGRVLASSPRGWLGPSLPVREDGGLKLPEGAEVAERLGPQEDAFFVRTAPLPRRRPTPTVAIRALDLGRAEITIDDWRAELSPRHSELVMRLALHPEGLTAKQLRSLAYDPGSKLVTVRAEIARLRRLLGPVLRGNPYRLEGRVRCDRAALELALGELAAARARLIETRPSRADR